LIDTSCQGGNIAVPRANNDAGVGATQDDEAVQLDKVTTIERQHRAAVSGGESQYLWIGYALICRPACCAVRTSWPILCS
jgi:hypothetical protein